MTTAATTTGTTTAATTTAATMTEPRRRRRREAMLRTIRGARARILVTVVGLLVASTALSTVLLREILGTRVGDRVDASLVQEVDEFRTLARVGIDPRTGRRLGSDVRVTFEVYLSRNVPDRGESWFAYVDGRPYSTTAGQERAAELAPRLARLARVTTPQRGRIELPGGPSVYVAVPIRVDGRTRGVFVATSDLAREEAEVDQAVQVAAIVALLVLALASVVAFLLVGRILLPLRELTATARAIGEEDLTRRIEVRGDDEFARLATTFNAMLDRLDAAFASQRAFVSDAGHELRTPITIVRGHLDVLGDDPLERAETMEIVEDELGRMSRIVEDLLLLAKAERDDFLRPETVDLDLFTEELATKARALGDREWTIEELGTGTLVGDRQRLTQAAMNLISNAVAHTEPGGTIGIGSAMADGEARLWVRDDGVGIDPADHHRVFERFARVGVRRRAGGAGLGLAIVSAIAEAHHGHVELASAAGEGALFTLVLPVAPVPVPDPEEPPS